jgi:hypothetical protein
MPEVIADTSPLQYLFQLGLLHLLPDFYGEISVPRSVVQELRSGLARGVALPDLDSLQWLRICEARNAAVLPLTVSLGAGEREVLALAVERVNSLVILDDALARRFAVRLRLRLTGTLGVLLRAKKTGRIESVRSYLDRLEDLRFRIDGATRRSVLTLAEERLG